MGVPERILPFTSKREPVSALVTKQSLSSNEEVHLSALSR